MEEWPTDKEEIALLRERVDEAGRAATNELKDQARDGHGKKRRREGGGRDERDRDDDVVEAGMPSGMKKKAKRRPGRRGSKAVPGEVSEAEANGEKAEGEPAAEGDASKPKKKKKKAVRTLPRVR